MRVALYARVSTEEQAIRGLSIEAQTAALDAWAEGQTVVDRYQDPGVSARKPISKRPQLQRLLRDVEQGKIDLVVFTKLDRWTRNIREYYKAQDILDAHGVAWKAIHEDYETETAAGRLKVNIMLAVAQDEADRTSERVKAVFEEKRRKGLVVNGHTPIGLAYENGALVQTEDAERVKALYNKYVALRSVTALARLSPEILGRPYSAVGVRSLLSNEKYVDVVTPEIWERVQAILATRSTRSGRTGRVYLFSGLLVCPVCGHRLKVSARKEYIYYRCGQYSVGQCTWNKSVPESKCEDYLLDTILPSVKRYNLTIRKKKDKPADVAALQKKLDRLTDLYIDESITREDFDRRAAPLRDAIKDAGLKPQAIDQEEVRSVLETYHSLSKTAQKAFWSYLIQRITPTGDGYEVDFVLP